MITDKPIMMPIWISVKDRWPDLEGYELESFTNRDAYSISVHKAIAAWNRRVT